MEILSLPQLNPLLRLYPSNPKFDGQPQWTLYHPVSNKYFSIGWMEYECLSRFHKHEKIEDLIQSIKNETTLDIDIDDIKNLLVFLNQNGLLNTVKNDKPDNKKHSLWKSAMHGYLYFTFPVFRPEKFLQKTLPYITPLFSKNLTSIMLIILVISILMTLPRIDEFLNSFTQMMTLEGVILGLIIYTSIKVLHEFGHAYSAARYNVAVPHMGVAFILLYPIFYTEVSGAWRLTDKKQRMVIGLSGVIVEFYIAAIALIIWNFMTPGLGQMVAFSVIMISLVGSLLINLNPLMRFDGYYVLSDWTGIENLHATAIDYARYSLRKTILGIEDEAPYSYPNHTAKSLTYFGFAVIIYRFFLFLGIAILVYHIFFKPLGLFMMLFELVWFIAIPVWKELQILYERRQEFIGNKKFKTTVCIFLMIIIFCALPFKNSIFSPGVIHFERYQVAYAPAPSIIDAIHVKNDEKVLEGELLATLSSPILQKELKLAEEKLENLKLLKRKYQTFSNANTYKDSTIDDKIKLAEIELSSLQKKQKKLSVIAEFDGIISDRNPDATVGQAIATDQILMRISVPDKIIVTTYIREDDLSKITVGNNAFFRPSYALFNSYTGRVLSIDQINIKTLDFAILASIHQNDLPVKATKNGLEPLNALYKVKIEINNAEQLSNLKTIVPGHVKIQSEAQSLITRFLKSSVQLIRYNLALNS